MSQTRSQAVAQRAYAAVADRKNSLGQDDQKKYLSFAQAFPTLVHQCGACQAAAFALAKGGEHEMVLDDIARVLTRPGGYDFPPVGTSLDRYARTADVMNYLRLTRDILTAAGWIKRYAEALLGEDGP